MSQENVELVVSLYDAVQQQEWERPFEVLDEDVVWDMSELEVPGLTGVYRGHAGIREFWSAWLAAWETLEFVALAPEDHGEHVIVEVQQRNRGRASGAEVELHYFQIATVRGGKVTACRLAETRTKALEAIGLSD